MNISELRSFILESDILPPTLAAELAKHVHEMPSEHVSWLVTLIDRAKLADEEYGRASKDYVDCIAAIEARAFQRVDAEEARIMAEFHRQVKGS